MLHVHCSCLQTSDYNPQLINWLSITLVFLYIYIYWHVRFLPVDLPYITITTEWSTQKASVFINKFYSAVYIYAYRSVLSIYQWLNARQSCTKPSIYAWQDGQQAAILGSVKIQQILPNSIYNSRFCDNSLAHINPFSTCISWRFARRKVAW